MGTIILALGSPAFGTGIMLLHDGESGGRVCELSDATRRVRPVAPSLHYRKGDGHPSAEGGDDYYP